MTSWLTLANVLSPEEHESQLFTTGCVVFKYREINFSMVSYTHYYVG